MVATRVIGLAAVGFVISLALPYAAGAQAPASGQQRSFEDLLARKKEVAAAAFDPVTYFGGDSSLPPMLTIAYTGDDWGWPVYSIAVRQGCPLRGERAPDCGSQRIARMVRAPAPAGMTRPRQRGSALVAQVEQGDLPIPAALDAAGLEWREADLATCSAANALLLQVAAIEWVPRHVYDPDPNNMQGIVIHADKVEVGFNAFAQRATYRGYVADGSAAAWAVKFAAALESCWTSTDAPPPWRTPEKKPG